MITLFIILCVVLFVIAIRSSHKQNQIVGLSREELLQKHRNAFSTYRFFVILSVVIFVGGYLLAKCYPMYETEKYEYWFFGTQKGTHEVLTATAWWSYILRGLAVLIFIPAIIGFTDRLKAIKKYEQMSGTEYLNLQKRTKLDIEKQEKAYKQYKRTKTAMSILEKLFN